MAAIEDHGYVKICAELAACLSVSIASARRQVDLVASREGARDLPSRKEIAERLLEKAQQSCTKTENSSAFQLDQLLEALAEDENFMVED